MTRLADVASLLILSSALCACEDDAVQGKPPPAATAKKAAPKAKAKGRRGLKGADEEPVDTGPAPPKVEYQEEDFNETERSRDPFRSFEDLFINQGRSAIQVQREVILDDVPLDDLKLIGIVSRIRPAKAMLLDPRGEGHVVHRNDYVGKAERVQVGTTNAEYEVNWRVDRIRDGDVVLIREDPTNPDVPSATRVIALRPDEQETN